MSVNGAGPQTHRVPDSKAIPAQEEKQTQAPAKTELQKTQGSKETRNRKQEEKDSQRRMEGPCHIHSRSVAKK